MDIKTYLSELSAEEREHFAKQVETSPAYLSQIASGYRNAGLTLAFKIEKATGSKVTAKSLSGIE